MYKWIVRGVPSFNEMTDLPLALREELAAKYGLYPGAVSAILEDPDGTVKFQILLHDGARVEAVLLADGEARRTACLSTQAGCPMGCVFCKTGTLGFARNLEGAEIVGQLLHIRAGRPVNIDNIVIMGMGEPLLNLSELRKALALMTDPPGQRQSPGQSPGLGYSKRRITVSTCGIIDGIGDLADNGPDVRLALSLTTADEKLRDRLMPVNRTNPLGELKKALLHYQQKQDRRITLEAVLLGGINTRLEDAEAMAAFARGLNAVINLIPWNPVDGMTFEGQSLREPAPGEIKRFMTELEKRGLNVTRRYRKGRSVGGACGQLGEALS